MAFANRKQSSDGKQRIVHIITHIGLGGAERVAVNIAKSKTEGAEYHIVEVMRGRGTFTEQLLRELRDAGIGYHRFIMPDIRFHFLFERIAAMVFPLWFLFVYLRLRPCAIHVHTETADLSLWAFMHLCPWVKGFRVVRTVHNTRLWTGQQKLGRRVERFFNRLDANVAISISVRDSYLSAYGKRLNIIYNGVETVDKKAFADVVKGRINILFAGRFEAQKGVAHLIEVLRRMSDDARYFFHIIGDGSLRDSIAEVVSTMPNARIYPSVYGLSSFIGSFDALFMPSEHEGLSMLSIEASMQGVPVIANNCPGLGDTLPPQWPLKVENNDIDGYMRLFETVVPNADLAALGRESQRFAQQNFGIRQMQEAYERLYFD